ncbi:MAG: molybdate ABC transporter permease subunit, partial [Thermoleophilia bacterium]|nr:molybdate ABC transporter permease subunit [Thermoleophilia bacterium]
MRAFTAGLWASLALAVAFLAVPLAALFLRVPPGELVSQLGSETAREALWVTVKANAVAQVIVLVVGTPAAYLLATRRFRGRDLVISVLELPLVLPPAVAGVALLA